ncbi:MAG: hypothetical protein NTY64_10350, partial [Deltaproteobacteria bacterium]|nr:hypothetical protein [Deltaproteobacteria bacterium]
MRSKAIFLFLGICLAFWGANPGASFAKTAGFCVECHSSKSMNPLNAYQTVERQSVYQTKLEPCPGLQSMGEEIFFTERRINQVNQILDTLDQKGWATSAQRKSAAEDAESWSKLKREENASYGLFSREAFSIRASLQKIYDRTVQARDESSRRWLIGLGSLIFVILLILLGMSFRKLKGMNKSFLLLLSLGSLSLTACSSSVAEPQKKSAGQERLEQSLFVAVQNTAKLEESSYQSILIAEMAREWAGIEAAPAEKALQLSWDMALAARKKGGEIAGQRELLSRWPDPASALKDNVSFDAVLDLRDEIRFADGRLWALRAVAEAWGQVNAKKGRDALDWVTREALGMKDLEMRDRELRSLAYAWSEFDRNR